MSDSPSDLLRAAGSSPGNRPFTTAAVISAALISSVVINTTVNKAANEAINEAANEGVSEAVNEAVNDHADSILIPKSNTQLIHSPVAPACTDQLNVAVCLGDIPISMQADCRRGWLNGNTPSIRGETELMHSVFQVAYGNV